MYLTYNFVDEDKRLGFVKTHWANYNGVEVNQIHKLFYGPYLTSDNEDITVLRKVRQATDIGEEILENVTTYRNCKECPVYDELDDMRDDMETLTNGIVGTHAYDPACEGCSQEQLKNPTNS